MASRGGGTVREPPPRLGEGVVVQELLQQLLNGVVVGGVYVLIAVGLTLIFGILGVVNFAHGELYMVGAYITLLLATGARLPILISILGGAIAAAALGLLLERTFLKPIRLAPPLNAIIVTMGLSYLLSDGARIVFTPAPRTLPPVLSGVIDIGGVVVSAQRLLILAVAAALITALHLFVRFTWIGTAMRCVAQDKVAARLVGIRLDQVAAVTMMISAALAAVAGGLIGPLFVVEPSMGARLAVKAFSVVVLGGVGNVAGAVWAGLLLGVTESLTAAFLATGIKDLVAFVMLLLVLLVRPAGLFGGAITRD